jgi:hypothetical protein
MASCGPGLETVHESNVRFEHCYRLDMDPRIAPSHRYACWRSWTQNYAYGQTRDRMEYARRRIIALESGDTDRVQVHEMPSRPERIFSEMGPEPERPPTAPAPTSAHAPPPATAPAPLPPPGPPPLPATDDDIPGAECTRNCAAAYRSCQGACRNDTAACTRCREDYRVCMRRCYE